METGAVVTILPCNDLDASERFYRRLGFVRVEPPEPDDPGTYRILTNGTGQLHLTDAVEGWLIPGKNPFGLYIYREDVDAVAAWFGATPRHTPWGMYEFSLSDPDETLVRVGWPSKAMT
jgi:catechol 2,3-dioxygenase-like lactoylglutathione lyase family enzyme